MIRADTDPGEVALAELEQRGRLIPLAHRRCDDGSHAKTIQHTTANPQRRSAEPVVTGAHICNERTATGDANVVLSQYLPLTGSIARDLTYDNSDLVKYGKSRNQGRKMIIVKLKEAMLAYGRKRGRRITYAELEELTGIPRGTLYSIGSRKNYYPTIPRIEILCRALEVPLHDMLEMIDDPPEPTSKPKRQAKSRKAATRR